MGPLVPRTVTTTATTPTTQQTNNTIILRENCDLDVARGAGVYASSTSPRGAGVPRGTVA